MDNKPKPHYKCFPCLRRIGYGYDRTARAFNIDKKSVYRWFRHHKCLIERPPAVIKRPILKPEPKAMTKGDWESKWEDLFKSKTQFQLRKYLRSKLWQFFKYGAHPKTTPILISCSMAELKTHIASKFKPSMTIENYTKEWEFDHIKPLAAFDLRTEWKTAFHYSNLQPLSPHDNRVKGVKSISKT